MFGYLLKLITMAKPAFSSIRILILVGFFSFAACFGCRRQKVSSSAAVPDAWYRNSMIYNLDVATYKDSDGDGTGDFRGLISKMGYLDSLGVSVLWLSPFQPSPGMDDGYDVTDYYGINPKLGNMEDFAAFIAAAKAHHISVIMDMVLNHTSIEHPWFRKSREDSTAGFHSRYVWSKKKPRDYNKGMAFQGVQTETWTYDEVAHAYYFHRFYDFQPDLNYQNKTVQAEAVRILQYWIGKGVQGFRLDAVPFIIDVPESGAQNPAHLFGVLDSLVRGTKERDQNALLLGEANVMPKETRDYFGENGQRLQMMFNFYANEYLFYSLAQEKPESFVKALQLTREKPGNSQWAYFLRNHDEIDLGRLTGKQRREVYARFGPEKTMQLYARGIRRRLAPMLHNDKQIRMAYSLLYSLPGTPVIRAGEEIGMGEDLTLRERLSVRTPMQWDATANAGFSTAVKPFRPVISMGEYSYRKVNVKTEQQDERSLLNFIRHLISVRRSNPEIGTADWRILATGNDAVLAIAYSSGRGQLLAVHNFSAAKVAFSLQEQGSFTDLLTGKLIVPDGKKVLLDGYGELWLQSHKRDAK